MLIVRRKKYGLSLTLQNLCSSLQGACGSIFVRLYFSGVSVYFMSSFPLLVCVICRMNINFFFFLSLQSYIFGDGFT